MINGKSKIQSWISESQIHHWDTITNEKPKDQCTLSKSQIEQFNSMVKPKTKRKKMITK